MVRFIWLCRGEQGLREREREMERGKVIT